MSTGRTTDDRDTDSARHNVLLSRLGEALTRLERIESKLDIMEQRERAGGLGFNSRQARRVEEGW